MFLTHVYIIALIITILLILLFMWNKYFCTPFYTITNNSLPINHKATNITSNGNILYIINNNTINTYTKTGTLIKNYNYPNIGNLISSCALDTELYCLDDNNTIYVFNAIMELTKTYNTDIYGKLEWINYYNNKWWGCYTNNGIKLARFNNVFIEEQSWDLLGLQTSTGGYWHDSILYLTNDTNGKIYLAKFDNKSSTIKLIYVINTPLLARNIYIQNNNNTIIGLNNITKEIYFLKLHKNIDLTFCMLQIVRNLFG